MISDKNDDRIGMAFTLQKSAAPLLLLNWSLPLLVISLMIIWSALFWKTFTFPFVWDDLHTIRHYSFSEVLSTFYGPADPDGIETASLRPIAVMFFQLQGSLFGENVILQHLFMVLLMAALFGVFGVLLWEVGLSLRHISIALLLFVSSRVFASLTLWIVLGYLIATYILMMLVALFYLRWIQRGSAYLLVLTLALSALSVFMREEAYTLPVALLLIWWLSARDRGDYWRPMIGALCVLAIVIFHYTLRSILIVRAPQPGLHLSHALTAVLSAAFPGGIQAIGPLDHLLGLCWILFLGCTAFTFFRIGDRRQRQLMLGICLLGLVLAAPAIAVARPFGIALPALAFFTAIAVAIVEIYQYLWPRRQRGGVLAKAVLSICLIGLTLGVVGGVRRSFYVAQSLNENSVEAAVRNGALLFGRPVTIPTQRRQLALAHLRNLGITSREDWMNLVTRRQTLDPSTVTPPMFKEKYMYLSF